MPTGIYKRTEETRKKISLARLKKKEKLGYMNSPETKKKISEAHKGKKLSEETKRKIGLANSGETHPCWKGDKAGKRVLHIWLKRHKPKTIFCEICNEYPPYDVANIKNHQYTRNPDDYKWLCRSCHKKMDLQNENEKQRTKKE